MKYLNKKSLFQTVDNVSKALLFNMDIDQNEKLEIAYFIANQQGLPNAYANTFAPTDTDFKNDLVLFTGEKIKSRVGKCHMIGEEASRILRKLNVQSEKISNVLQNADKSLSAQIFHYLEDSRYEYGMYCCKSCSCGLWINLASGGLNNNTDMLKAGLRYLKKYRDNKGSWKGFPGNYLLYVLNEIDIDLAKEELNYAASSIERKLKRSKSNETKYEMRRNFIYEQILNRLNIN